MNPRLESLVEARCHDPFAYLGAHRHDHGWVVRVFDPHATAVALESGPRLSRIHDAGVWEVVVEHAPQLPCRLHFDYEWGTILRHDPYFFGTVLTDHDLHLFNEGRLRQAWRTLGAHPHVMAGVTGVRFAVWAPNAERVSVVGEFNYWDGRVHPMRNLGASGVWEIFVPELAEGTLYKFELRARGSGQIVLKSDPYAQEFERRPGTASRVATATNHVWSDQDWMAARAGRDWLHSPMNIYEVHPGSWRRHPDGRFYTWRELADVLVPYVLGMGYTHIELLPVSEHPLDESWGYQSTGYFAPTSRFGSPDDLRHFVNECHRAGIGLILDWVPAHFPADAWSLAHFDGTGLYEHEDPRLGFHQDWGTHIFNYGRNEVRSFLLSSAHYWLSEFHFDGLRVDAVASMLYLDYSRKGGDWIPNRYGGRENLDAIDFLREMNELVHGEFPGALSFAEESTAWPMVSRPVYLGGLGFSMKWNMGWMNDTLTYFCKDPVHRRFHHNELTFGQLYAYTENFVLPLSHDEVVHGKGSLLDKMPGDAWQKFANLRLLLAYQMASPGKKLMFMGGEMAQGREWNAGWELDWNLLEIDWHAAAQRLARDLNRLYRNTPALHDLDFDSAGFQWIDCHDADQSVLAFLRHARDGAFVAAAFNFTPVPREEYRIGVPAGGRYREILNTDSVFYEGSNIGNGAGLIADDTPWMGFPHSLTLTLPPLAAVILARA